MKCSASMSDLVKIADSFCVKTLSSSFSFYLAITLSREYLLMHEKHTLVSMVKL